MLHLFGGSPDSGGNISGNTDGAGRSAQPRGRSDGQRAPQFVQDDSPFAESRYRARFYIRLARLNMAEGDEFELFTAFSPTGQPKLKLLLSGLDGRKKLRMAVVLDDGSVVSTPAGSETILLPHWNAVEIDWQAAWRPAPTTARSTCASTASRSRRVPRSTRTKRASAWCAGARWLASTPPPPARSR